jgi:hypothetical protein
VATYVDQDIVARAQQDGAVPSVDYLETVLPDFADLAPGLAIAAAGPNIQVDLDGQSACLVLSPDGTSQGTVVDGRC